MSEDGKTPYRVLARKYRPRNFDELVGQDALVRTLKNAIESGRIAHAFMLTGIRGTGKTTTARIIAKALNYKGSDGTAGPTTGSTDDCEICRAIAEDRHPDVLEMDAASRTGVDDIREILDGVRYAPVSARYKVYIVDEVHMLSKNAFNALLKTLEEPPPHVIFIFATTEIRKVPVTVLSRCQRFDLRRVDIPTLATHYRDICGLENVGIEDEALTLIARAADGSVRDGLSLLDQAIALGGEKITAAQVQDMLGLADRTAVLDILEQSLKGDCAKALDGIADLYAKGADPAVIIGDMLDFTHVLTRLRAVPGTQDTAQSALSKDTLARAVTLSGKLSMPTLGRAWQILLKGLSEVNAAPNPRAAAEMLVIRLAYAADLPDPADLLKKLKGAQIPAGSEPASVSQTQHRTAEPVALGGGGFSGVAAAVVARPAVQEHVNQDISSLADIEALLRAHKHVTLAGQVYQYVHQVRLETGLLEIALDPDAGRDVPADLKRFLSETTGRSWMVSVVSAAGAKSAPTLAQQAVLAEKARVDEALRHPVVAQVIAMFPNATVKVTTEKE